MMRHKKIAASCSVLAIITMLAAANASETQTYTYDDLGRLVAVAYSGTTNNGQKHSLCYDSSGNRTKYKSDAAGGAAICPTPTPAPTPTPTQTPTPTPTSPPNNPPVANSDGMSVQVCSTGSKNVVANDVDPDGDTLSLTSASSSTVDASIESATTIQVTAGGAPGGASVTYTISDGRGGTATGYLSVSIVNGSGCQ